MNARRKPVLACGVAFATLAGAVFSLALPAFSARLALQGAWLAEDIGGGGVIDRLQTTLEIAKDGTARGNAGCNHYTGKAVISEESIVFEALAATEMACTPAVMEQEGKFMTLLRDSAQWRVDEEKRKLSLLDKRGVPLIVFARLD